MEPLADALQFGGAMILEGGKCIARKQEGKWSVEVRGTTADEMLQVIREVELLSGADLTVYSVMDRLEASRASGLTGIALQRSQQRLSDEPFSIARGRVSAVVSTARKLGYELRKEGGLFRLHRNEEISAFQQVKNEVRCRTAVAVRLSDHDAHYRTVADVELVIPTEDADGIDAGRKWANVVAEQLDRHEKPRLFERSRPALRSEAQ
jgi:hypothetical protein